MRARTGLLILAVTLPLTVQALAPQAWGARAVCRLVRDAGGDARLVLSPALPLPLAPGGATDDLLSADVASDGRTVTAVLRLAGLSLSDPASPGGHAYTLSFTVRGTSTPQFITAVTYPTGTQFAYGYAYVDAAGLAHVRVAGEGRGTVDLAHREVRVHVPATALRGHVRRGSVLLDLAAGSYRVLGQGKVPARDVLGVTVPLDGAKAVFDHAEGDRYVVGTASCVRPGR